MKVVMQKCLIYKLTQEIVHVATIDNVHLNVDEVFEYLVDLNEKLVRIIHPCIKI